jgi:hypothetical protein
MSYAKFQAAVAAGNYARAGTVLAAANNVDAYPLVAALFQLAFLAKVPALNPAVDFRAVTALLGGAANVPRSARSGVAALAAYVARLAGEVAYGDY